MAMTKAERSQMDALYTRAALAWPPPPPKPIDIDVALVASGPKPFRGWWFNLHSRQVGEGVSLGHTHSTTPYTDKQLANRYGGNSRVVMMQGAGGPWFASKLDALRALHFAMAQRCAEDLAAVQRCVEQEQQEGEL